MKLRNTIFLVCMMLVALSSCQDKADTQPTITVTIEPLRYFVEQIAGDKFKVVTLVPGGSSPETYEPTARQMMELVNSELYIQVGNLGFERTWAKRMQGAAQHLIAIDSSEGILPIECGDHSCHDPHVWTSPSNALKIAQNIYKALAMIDGKDSIYFRANLDSLCDKIMSVDDQIDKMLKNVSRRTFLIYHPSLTYFAHDYKLRQLSMEEDGKEPSVATLRHLVSVAQADSVRLMFVQKEFNNRNTETLLKATGAKEVIINPLSYDWENEMLRIAQALCKQ